MLLLPGCNGPPQPAPPADLELHGPTMGTQYNIRAYGIPDGVTQAELQQGVDDVLARLDAQMSTWRDDSELARFNNSDSTEWFEVSPETARVVDEALRISRLSGGAFDATIDPVFELWGFGEGGNHSRIPSDEQIAAALQAVGSDKIEIRLSPPALRKTRGDVQIVLSAIAKGFGVDQVAEYLAGQGVQAFMVEIGGEIRTQGKKPDGSPWKVGIEKPTPGVREVGRVIELQNLSLATSGDYRNFFERDGKRYSHTFDPRTGRPIEHALTSVTVIAENCMWADACATTLMVLGPDDGYDWAVKQNLAVLFFIRDKGDRFTQKSTPKFQELERRRVDW